MPDGRVLFAPGDDPFEPSPTWVRIDDPTGTTFPDNFVSGYDTQNGRQSLVDQTDTGTATVYLNDYEQALFDPRNTGSPYYGAITGKQIMCQIWNPVTETWEQQFQGWIDETTWDIDGSAVDKNGDPVNASIQLDCVDVFETLNNHGVTPGLDGVQGPAGAQQSVYYAPTSGTCGDRIVEVLADVLLDPTRYIVASGNVKLLAGQYDPDESALTVLRDACDADVPFIANMYVNRFGQFVFRGRYSRFTPDTVAAEPGSDWDFQRWSVGDGKAITADSTRAQMRVLSYLRSRANIINAAMCYPNGLSPFNIPDQVYADPTSIGAYGRHEAQPMTDLLTGHDTVIDEDGPAVCQLFAKLLVENQKDPRVAVSALQALAIRPDDPRAEATWAFICGADISHIVNVAVGYPGGIGFAGSSPEDDYYIEGRALTVRPLNPTHDMVTLDLEVSPAVWSMDTHGVFG